MTTLGLTYGLARLPSRVQALVSRSRSLLPIFPPKSFSTSLSALNDNETPASKALEKIPYPTTPPDSSLFETWSPEYEDIVVRTRRRQDERTDPSAVLRQLVIDGKYDEAEVVRKELVELGVKIRPRTVYYKAAEHFLKRKHHKHRAMMFINWWLLVPLTQDNKRRLKTIQQLLYFRSDGADIKTVARFALISTEKGCGWQVGLQAIAHIVRATSPKYSASFMKKLTDADMAYHETANHPETMARAREHMSRFWSLAVRTQCTADRPDAALALLELARLRGIVVSEFTHRFLLGKLESVNNLDGVAAVRAAYQADYQQTLDLDAPLPSARNLYPLGQAPREITLTMNASHPFKTNLAIVMQIVKRGPVTGEPVHARDIVPFFDIYKGDLRGGQEVMKLFSRVYQFSISALQTVILAEMLHHHRRQEYIETLHVFRQFFYLVGVPHRDVKQRLYKRSEYPQHLQLTNSLPGRITTTTFNLPSKLWPTKYHTAIAWGALVQSADTISILEGLYGRLNFEVDDSRQRFSHGTTVQDLQDADDGIHKKKPFAPTQTYDAAHYQPFLRAFNMLQGPERVLEVLDDMEKKGITPSSNNLILAAGLQAKAGSEDAALALLAELEIMHADQLHALSEAEPEPDAPEITDARPEEKSTWEEQLEDGLPLASKDARPIEMLVAYTTVLRGFVDRRMLAVARDVARRLFERLHYRRGSNVRTDEALEYLRLLEDGVELPEHTLRPGEILGREAELPPRLASRTLGPRQPKEDDDWE